MRETVCFAYYVDDAFIGWYGDSFGSITKTPKIYGNLVSQISTIQSNLNYKIQRINETSFEKEMTKLSPTGNALEALRLLIFSDEKALRGRKVELKMVACPIYDGPNPDFNQEEYSKNEDARRADMKVKGILDFPPASKERIDAIDAYNLEHPRPKKDSWIYANYEEVKVWAEIEPTEFLMILTPKLV